MSIAAYAGHALDPEVKGLDGEPSLFKEWHDEASEAAIDVQADLVLGSELSERDNVILVAVREVDCRTNELHAGLVCKIPPHLVCLYSRG